MADVTESSTTVTKTCSSTMETSRKANMYISLFILILVFVWVILFSFNPKMVQKTVVDGAEPVENAPPDPVYCFWGSFIISLIVVIIIALIKTCM